MGDQGGRERISRVNFLRFISFCTKVSLPWLRCRKVVQNYVVIVLHIVGVVVAVTLCHTKT